MSKPSQFTASTLKKVLVSGVLEFGPILIFLAAFGHFHVYKATMVLMATTIISTVLTYRIQKRLPYIALYMAFITIVFGYMTLLHKEPKFIQMRDTLFDMTMAATLLFGLIINMPLFKLAFHDVLPMTERAWYRLTYAWTAFFLVVALMNELIRRSYTLEQWFHFKGAMVCVTIVFGLLTTYLFYEKEEKPHTPRTR